MRNREGTVLAAAREADRTVKPEPPEDMWDKLDAVFEEHRKKTAIQPPEDSFLPAEYAERAGVKISAAQHRLAELVVAKKLKRVKIGTKFYYYLPK